MRYPFRITSTAGFTLMVDPDGNDELTAPHAHGPTSYSPILLRALLSIYSSILVLWLNPLIPRHLFCLWKISSRSTVTLHPLGSYTCDPTYFVSVFRPYHTMPPYLIAYPSFFPL